MSGAETQASPSAPAPLSSAPAHAQEETRGACGRSQEGGAPGTQPVQVVRDLFGAESVVLVGASDDSEKASGRTLKYLHKYGYSGAIYVVNPRRQTVQGVSSYASLYDLPATPDLAVVIVPAEGVLKVIRDCGAIGIRTAIVFASGYAEVGGDGARKQEELLQVCHESGVRLIGPNSVGSVGAEVGLTAAFMTGLDQDRFSLKDDGIAFVSQSGAMGAFILNVAQSLSLGIGRFVSTGNEVDVTISDIMDGLIEGGSTRGILGYIEGVRDASRFRTALEKARDHGVPVALMKVGKSKRGAAAARSHTGSLAGSDIVYDSLFKQLGVHRAESIDDFVDIGRLMAANHRPYGNRVSIVTISGGAGVLMADVAEEVGLELAEWNDFWTSRVAQELPSFAAVGNPIDTTGMIASDPSLLRRALDVCIQHPGTDVVVAMLGNLEQVDEAICRDLVDLASRSRKALVVTWVGGSGRPLRMLAEHGIPVFSDPVRAMRALGAFVRQGIDLEGREGVPVKAEEILNPAYPSVLDEVVSKRILSEAGLPCVLEHEALDADGAVQAAEALGYPVVVKLLSDSIAHKTDHGFVRLSLRTAQEVRDAVSLMEAAAASLSIPSPKFVLQPMVDVQTELLLGMARDVAFGPVIMLGMGGVHAEIDPDVQVRLPPVSPSAAREMVYSLRGSRVLRGYRGQAGANEDALVDLIVNFSEWAAANWRNFDSVDVNPVVVDRQGDLVVVDAVLVPSDEFGCDLS